MTKNSIFRLFKGNQPPLTRIFVRGLLVQASIGVHPHEHEETQPVIIDIELDMGDMPLPEEDRLHETLDYAIIAEKAEEIASIADGTVVGSAIVSEIAAGKPVAEVLDFVKSLADGAHRA